MQTGETTIRASRCQARRPTGGAGPRRLGRPGGPRKGGFTLTEIMIALGVLAVGMAMIAGALHAGIQIHLRTIDDIMRQLIGDNTLAIVQARVRHTPGTVNAANPGNGITDTYKLLGSTYFGSGDLKYPWNTTDTPYGAAVLMKCRKIDANSANDYDVLIVPYTIIPATPTGSPGEVTATTLSCTIRAGTIGSSIGSTITAPSNTLKAGSVVIDSRNGAQICIVKSAPTATTAEVSETLTPSTTNVTLTTLTPTVTANRLECNKPVRTRTALSPKPGWKPGDN